MDGLDYWRLCDQLSVIQAALLIAGIDPSSENANVENWQTHERPTGYEAAKAAISNALRSGGIKGQITPHFEYDIIKGDTVPSRDNRIDLSESRVEVESLRSWLAGRGFRTGFFFPNATDEPDYLDPTHPRYAPKLAAAVHAWLATGDESAIKNKSPKQALLRWLRENAAQYGLADDEGKPNETGVEEIAKVTNWQPGGGAPKTLTG
jgi:hypothetical protein